MLKFAATDHYSGLPLISSDSGPMYRCPGESAPISPAIHFARLKEGWNACAECIWSKHVPEPESSMQGAVQSRRRARHDIRRTTFGVRGAYLNAIDRFRGAELASILATHLVNISRLEFEEHTANTDDQAHRVACRRIVIGHDGRPGSADIFAGVVSAVLQNGCNVVDVGRCTAASLLSVTRFQSDFAGCMLVTGAGGSPGDVGIDVFTADGRSVSIPWHEFGVGIRSNHERESIVAGHSGTKESAEPFDSDKAGSANVWEHLSRIRSQPLQGPAVTERGVSEFTRGGLRSEAEVNASGERVATVILPEAGKKKRSLRSGRSSGELTMLPLELTYRNWVKRWWPSSFDVPVMFRVSDDLVGERLVSIAEQCSVSLLLRRTEETASIAKTDHAGGAPVCFEVSEDDRFMSVVSRRGRRIGAEELANWINKATRTSASHVTAHASSDGDRVLLLDVGSPTSGRSHEVISDALAIAGFLLTLLRNDRNHLPS